MKEGHIAHLMKMLKESYRTLYKTQKQLEDGIKEVMNWLTECIRYSNIITIFDIRRCQDNDWLITWIVLLNNFTFFDRETELDKKILTALLKSDNMSLNHQLFLAMVWDRVDLVEEKILTKGKPRVQTGRYLSALTGDACRDLANLHEYVEATKQSSIKHQVGVGVASGLNVSYRYFELYGRPKRNHDAGPADGAGRVHRAPRHERLCHAVLLDSREAERTVQRSGKSFACTTSQSYRVYHS